MCERELCIRQVISSRVFVLEKHELPLYVLVEVRDHPVRLAMKSAVRVQITTLT